MGRVWGQVAVLLAVALLIGCADELDAGLADRESTAEASPAVELPRLAAQVAFENYEEERPLLLTYPPDGSDRVAIVSQTGRVSMLPNQPDTDDIALFLDISGRVRDWREGHNEEGLLGLAFHPRFAQNGRFYVYYSASDPRRTVLSRFTMSDDPNVADPQSETVLLEIPQPYGNHNGGNLAFGPDGYLYIAVGDGGSSGDPDGHGQNPATLLGSILRIDVDSEEPDLPYGIPPDNPLASPASQEIWAYGLRNPWRFSFDRQTGDLWVGDVGQNHWEEINLVQGGLNYGWNIMEGTHCFPPGTECDPESLELPVVDYPISGEPECSVTGGYMYRGTDMPPLNGAYIYGDFCSGVIWAFTYGEGQPPRPQELARTGLMISSFGEDEAGELYVTAFDGRVYRLSAE